MGDAPVALAAGFLGSGGVAAHDAPLGAVDPGLAVVLDQRRMGRTAFSGREHQLLAVRLERDSADPLVFGLAALGVSDRDAVQVTLAEHPRELLAVGRQPRRARSVRVAAERLLAAQDGALHFRTRRRR